MADKAEKVVDSVEALPSAHDLWAMLWALFRRNAPPALLMLVLFLGLFLATAPTSFPSLAGWWCGWLGFALRNCAVSLFINPGSVLALQLALLEDTDSDPMRPDWTEVPAKKMPLASNPALRLGLLWFLYLSVTFAVELASLTTLAPIVGSSVASVIGIFLTALTRSLLPMLVAKKRRSALRLCAFLVVEGLVMGLWVSPSAIAISWLPSELRALAFPLVLSIAEAFLIIGIDAVPAVKQYEVDSRALLISAARCVAVMQGMRTALLYSMDSTISLVIGMVGSSISESLVRNGLASRLRVWVARKQGKQAVLDDFIGPYERIVNRSKFFFEHVPGFLAAMLLAFDLPIKETLQVSCPGGYLDSIRSLWWLLPIVFVQEMLADMLTLFVAVKVWPGSLKYSQRRPLDKFWHRALLYGGAYYMSYLSFEGILETSLGLS